MAGDRQGLKQLSCPGCGAALVVRGMGNTTTLACGSCGAVIDITSEHYKVLQVATAMKDEPIIPLGERGRIDETIFEVIGFMQRSTTNIWGTFRWEEYLLFNPRSGFRWLGQTDGHWTFDKPLKKAFDGRFSRVRDDERGYRLFAEDSVVVEAVLGEFYWEVKVGDRSKIRDYIAPPYSLSQETSEGEESWSAGRYLPRDELLEAFPYLKKNPGVLPSPSGIGATQPFPVQHIFMYHMTCVLALVVAFFVHQMATSNMRSEHLTRGSFSYVPVKGQPPASSGFFGLIRSPVGESLPKVERTNTFAIPNPAKNIVIDVSMTGQNQWIEPEVSLVNAETGETWEGATEVSFYEGRDSDGYWSEGSRSGEIWLSRVPAGRYYLTIETVGDATASQSIPYQVDVRKDKPIRGNLAITCILLLSVPAFLEIWRRGHEKSRWENSSV